MSRVNRRVALFMGLALLFMGGLMGRAFYVQVVAAPVLQTKADSQHVRTIELDAPRGIIMDRDGHPLAISQSMATVYAGPSRIKDPAKVAGQIAPLLACSEEGLYKKLSGDSSSILLARKIDQETGEKIKELKIPHVWVLAEDKRVYPKGALAPQLLGFVGADNEGLAGIEYQYEEVLSGTAGTMEVLSDLSGNRLSTVSVKEPILGESLSLTIDNDIQFETEKILAATVQEFEAKKACAVVLDPSTGEVLAMANTPVFDTNDFSSVEEVDRRNMVVTDQYEPGSTFKMVVTAAALEGGLVTPETTFTLGRQIEVYDRVVHESHAEGLPEKRELTVTQILAQSSNVGAVTLGKEVVGKAGLVDMIRRFGFTEKLEVDFPGEAKGQMLAPEKWSGTTIANVPIGQGIAASPLQLAVAYAAIANNGRLVQPRLVRHAIQPWTRQVVSPLVASELRDMLTVTVADGTGTRAQVEGYVVAGKTGTAQKVKEGGGGYAEDRYIASFVGMVPADAPRLVILVMVDEPATQHLGAYVAAPAFAKIADFSLKCLGIAPTVAE